MDAASPCNSSGMCGVLNATGGSIGGTRGPSSRLHEFQIVKAAVLAVVTLVILVSVSKMVFQLFVKFAVRTGDK